MVQFFSKITFYTSSFISSTQSVRLAIYNVVSCLPSKLIVDLESISFTSAGYKEISCSVLLSHGWYAIGLIFNPSSMTIFAPVIGLNNLLGASSLGSSLCGFRATLAYGTFPSIASLTNIAEINAPLIWLKTS